MFSKHSNLFSEDFNLFLDKDNNYLAQYYEIYKGNDEPSFDFFKELSSSSENNQSEKNAKNNLQFSLIDKNCLTSSK